MTGDIKQQWLQSKHKTYSCTGGFIADTAPEEPAYLFCASRLESSAAGFLENFHGAVSYAVKANPEARVLQTLHKAGVSHFDVASIEEVRSTLAIAPNAVLHFNNPVKDLAAITEAYARYGVRSFALDETSEFDKIYRACGGDTNVRYTVRFKLEHAGAAYDFGSKFGASTDAAVQLMRLIRARGGKAALTFHPGSQCVDPGMYRRYIEAAGDIISRAGSAPDLVNVGGGFPVAYACAEVPTLSEFFSEIHAAAAEFLPPKTELMCEPGRAMVADSVSLLSRVIHVRDCGRSLFINDGVYGGMQEQLLVDLHLPVRAWRGDKPLTGALQDYHIFGPTCDPVDRLARATPLPANMRTGDYIEFGLLGAYGSATSTRFNGFAPADYRDVLVAGEFTTR
jgi:ornithine decarboxylase